MINKSPRHFTVVLLGAVLCGAASASAQTSAPPPADASSRPATAASGASTDPGSAEYILGPEDVLEIEIVGQPDKMRARVYTDGTVQLNLVGKVVAQGKTPRQLGDEIAGLLKSGGFYANPVVNVEVSGYASRFVTVLGQVASPGLIPINRPYRLSEILARVGGTQAAAADYLIVKSEVGEERRYQISDLATGDASKDPYVAAGDKIFAPQAELFYISGQVMSPGAFPAKAETTIAQAIARAGGLTASGSDKKVQVTRAGKKIKLRGDALVQPGDVLVVGERLF